MIANGGAPPYIFHGTPLLHIHYSYLYTILICTIIPKFQ